MNQRWRAVVLVAGASTGAAAGGAYLALRSDATPEVTSAVTETLSDQAAASLPSTTAVTETEGVIAATPATEAEVGKSKANDQMTATAGPAANATRATNRAEGQVASRRRASVAPPAAPSATPDRPAGQPRSASADTRREPVERSAPSSPASQPQSLPEALPEPAPAESAPVLAEATLPEPPRPVLQELTVPAESVIGLQIENSITSERAKVEDRVEARVTRDVRSGGRVAIPAGSRMQGSVTLVERGGKVKERARLGVRFHTLVLADGARLPVQTETIYREGESPAGESAAKIGGAAVGGALLGANLGGGKGAAIGGSIGAAGGTAAVMASDRNPATLQAGSTVTVRLQGPVTLTVED